ncbi:MULTISPECIES: GNAT family N-acetyltransferase [unclassified Maribacter]|uniref:GNAT family N-acetyltransferase n=1 Tax=unclassified Maribacter TaxID=2615042 RepID=UPI002579EAEB|nr:MULTISPECIES: GNAT family N-acetyltransferase [unclassified Maribacter]|tara:strand:- start:19920 stop:20762 length:843 start_codon:yes stop_codon:yes gene_type:complete
MEFKTLDGINRKEILNVFNKSFSDYFIPFHLTEEQLSFKMTADKINLSLSVGVFENSNLIAFILHGFDKVNNEKTIYNGGTGVIPEKRGSGLTKQMHQFILPLLKEKGIDMLQLEVIKVNSQAIISYEKSGYKIARELVCYKGEVSISNTNNGLQIRKLHNYYWDLMESFWDVYPTWQNSKNVINELRPNNISLGSYIDNLLIGYIVFNPKNNRILQIAVSPKFRQKKVASTLVKQLTETYGNTLSIINVDKSSNCINTFFKRIGLKNHLEQLEMKFHLE